jgi:putative ATPase
MSQTELFDQEQTYQRKRIKPWADSLRPSTWDDYVGLEKIDRNLIKYIKAGKGLPPSLILWGPPGSGKTTLAKLIGQSFDCFFVEFSAVLGGVKEVREIVEQAKNRTKPTLLFVDEIHRFNKGQQDAFLPHVENGTISLIGATTENPSFYLTQALLSRLRLVVLSEHKSSELVNIFDRVAKLKNINFADDAKNLFIKSAQGDARKLINLLESFAGASMISDNQIIKADQVKEFLNSALALYYDRSGEQHYNIISAFIKSLRGSDPDGALYWGFRMLEAGEDPRFIIRRMIIFASEDIGNADPQALTLAVSTAQAFDRVGLPEGKIPIAHCITYLATAPKSNRSYMAMHKVLDAIKENPRAEVPLHLRNAPTAMMKDLGYGKDYQYPHDYENSIVEGVVYLPEELKHKKFY